MWACKIAALWNVSLGVFVALTSKQHELDLGMWSECVYVLWPKDNNFCCAIRKISVSYVPMWK